MHGMLFGGKAYNEKVTNDDSREDGGLKLGIFWQK